MNRFENTASLALLMGGESLAGEIEKITDRLHISPAGNLSRIFSEDIRVAVIQVLRKDYQSLADYIIDMNLYVADAVNRRAQLVCFPAYTGLLPVSFLPQFKSVLPKLRPIASTGLPDIEDLNDILSYFSDVVFDVYFHTMETLAERHGVYIMAGSTVYFEKDELFHRSFLFNNKGDLVGFQDKLSQNALERELEIGPACELKVFDTPLGQLAILIGEDADYFETARVAKNMGAQIIINPNVFTRGQTAVNTALGINMRVQEACVYGVQSVLVGDTALGFTAKGAGRAFAPNAFLARKNGVLAETSGSMQPDIACARLNLDILEKKTPYINGKNPTLMKQYIDRLY
ncbi:MAG: hypothetical protein FWG94_02240 [Oscillospiraceae bacterium]|nr:hypothetical protein [Oscillospiraceae bacterium]